MLPAASTCCSTPPILLEQLRHRRARPDANSFCSSHCSLPQLFFWCSLTQLCCWACMKCWHNFFIWSARAVSQPIRRVPQGTKYSSPALQRWVAVEIEPSPVGTVPQALFEFTRYYVSLNARCNSASPHLPTFTETSGLLRPCSPTSAALASI